MDDICALCVQAGTAEVTRRARAADAVHLFPIGKKDSLRRSLCSNAVLVL